MGIREIVVLAVGLRLRILNGRGLSGGFGVGDGDEWWVRGKGVRV